MTPFLDSTLEHHKSDLTRPQKPRKSSPELGADRFDTDSRSTTGEPNRTDMRMRTENTIPLETSLPDIIACASGDCTIAIIPASAFRRLTSKFPRSASHIIQMVLTKLYRVTFQTAHNYLGLTREIINTEVVLNRSNNFELPYYLKEAAIRKIKLQEMSSKEAKVETSKSSQKVRTSLNRNTSKAYVAPHSLLKSRGSRHVVLDSRDHLNPGDLLSNVPLSRKDTPSIRNMSSTSVYQVDSGKSGKGAKNLNAQSGAQVSSLSSMSDQTKSRRKNIGSSSLNPTSDDDEIRARTFSAAQEETEESSWRIALVEGMFSYLGITKENILPAPDDNDSSSSPFRRPSEVSLTPSSQVGHSPAFRLLSANQFITKKGSKNGPKTEYKEEVPSNIDFDSVKDEFAQGLQMMFVPEKSTIVSQNNYNKGLYYIISGFLEVIWTNEENNTEHVLYTVKPGGIAGYLASLIGSKSFVTLKAKTDLYVGFLPAPSLERLCDKYFMIYLRIAESLTNLLDPKILKLDYALEWIHLDASEILFNQDDPANAIYVVLSGRLRQLHRYNETEPEALEKKNRKEHLRGHSRVKAIREYAQGESLGEVDVLTAINRLSTVVALRDTELARIPRSLFELLALEHPSIMIRVSRLVARKIIQQQRGSESPQTIKSANKYDYNLLIPPTETTKGSVINETHAATAPSGGSGRQSYRTITILPITQGLPVEEFASKLVSALKQVGTSTIGLNQSATLSHLGRHAFDGLSKLKQSGYFAELEEIYDTVVYIADTPVNSSWTTTCINQGDCILLLAYSAIAPEIGEFERLLIKSKSNARIELILLHAERNVEPGLTHKWLKNRMWVHSHHHVQFSTPEFVKDQEPTLKEASGAKNFIESLKKRERLNHITRQTQENISRLLPDSLKNTVENFSSKYINKKPRYYTPVHSHKNDFLRLARILSGKAIGLVLGGGGARGISHLGMLRAIEEHGIPIDMIGGTSIGAFVGGLYAKDYDLVPIYGRMKKFAGRVGSVWRLLTDLTWPVTSYTTGHEFNRGIWKTFGDIRIEDFWIQYYCNSTNITESIQDIHSSGYAWRYIRASMSLAGLLPPMEDNGSMLLDGGYVDNLPVWEMKARGCNTIFAVDVGSVDDRTPLRYGDSLSGFWIVFNRWNPFSDYPNIPNMTEIQMRLGYVASVNALEKAKNTPGVIYARPPIEDYATLDFAKFEEIYQVGTAYGHDFFQELEKQNKMPKIPGSEVLPDDPKLRHRMLRRRNSV